MKMKKFSLVALPLIVALAAFAVSTLAAVTPSRSTVTLSAGAGNWTNAEDYVVAKFVRVQATGVVPATSTGSVLHINGTVTNTLCTLITATGVGTYTETNVTYFFKGDMLRVTGVGTNAGSATLIFDKYP
jgi:hypothetical protein